MKLIHDLSRDDIVRRQADRLVDGFPHDALDRLADDLESDQSECEGLAIGLLIATELRRRAAAGVRKWPTNKS